MEQFKNESEAIRSAEALIKDYTEASYLDKAGWLSKLDEFEKLIPVEFSEARRIVQRYTAITPATAMQRAHALVHRIETAGPKTYVLPMREQARAMLNGLPRGDSYASVRDLLRHYATQGD